MTEPVSIEVSKLLLEIGYDEECDYYYPLDGTNELVRHPYDKWKNSEIKHGVPYHKKKYQIQCISAPTIGEVVMWFYKTYKVWIYVKQGYDWEWFIETVDNQPKIIGNDGLNTSPIAAYNSAFEFYIKTGKVKQS